MLIVDDDSDVLTLLGEVGRQCRYDIALMGSIAEFHDIYDTFDPSAMILNLKYDHGDAINLMTFLQVVCCSGLR